ncbi:MAG: J domain-containing protein [Betaproteobacteria bacterium]
MAKISNLDFYALLGVHPNAEDIVIRAAFKALAQRYHPDRYAGPKDDAHRRMADLTNAYETLADPARRRKYDRRRGLSGRTARFYFKNPARDRSPFGVLAARAAAEKQRRYRLAVYVLMVAVVILSAFNVHQHAPQIRELFASGRASPVIPAAVDSRGSVRSSSSATPDASQPAATTANVRILPIGQGSTRPIGSNPIDSPAIASPAADTTAAQDTPAPAPVLATPMAAPPPAAEPARPTMAPATAAPSPATPAAASSAAAAPPLSDAAHNDATRIIAKPAVGRPAAPIRPTAPPPAASAPERGECRDEVLALGLCSRNPSTKGQ